MMISELHQLNDGFVNNFVSKTACWSGYGTVSVKVKKGDRVATHVGGNGTVTSTDALYVSFFLDEGAT